MRAANRIMAKQEEAPAAPAAEPADVALLREIRDELRKKGCAAGESPSGGSGRDPEERVERF